MRRIVFLFAGAQDLIDDLAQALKPVQSLRVQGVNLPVEWAVHT